MCWINCSLLWYLIPATSKLHRWKLEKGFSSPKKHIVSSSLFDVQLKPLIFSGSWCTFFLVYFFPCITRVEPSILQLPLRSSNFLAFFSMGLRYCRSFSVSTQYSLSTYTPSGRCFLHCNNRSQSCQLANLIEIGRLLCSLYLPNLSVHSIGMFSITSILSAIVLLLTV